MTGPSALRYAVPVAAVAAVAALCVRNDFAPRLLAQPKTAGSSYLQKDAPPEAPVRVGAAVCQDCHNEGDPDKQRPKPLNVQTQSFHFVRLFENRVWEVHDLHSKAFENLTNELGLRMQERIGRATGAKDYSATADVNCLACHASSQDPRQAISERTAASFEGRDGVGCEMCHGHGSQYEKAHKDSFELPGKPEPGLPTRSVPWRDSDPLKKARWGLVDLRDPAAAARKCASCHVGNKEEGKFVTHDMYVAGHPPLPPMDLLAYAREQPRHWGLPREMKYLRELAETDPAKAWRVFHYRGEGEELSAARRLAEGTVGAFRAAVDLLRQQAIEEKGAADPADGKGGGRGLDFAAFDCYACHHDLKHPSPRQARGYTGRAGRPLFRPASFALVEIVVRHGAEAKGGGPLKADLAEWDGLRAKLESAFGARTLGDPERISEAAAAIDGWCRRVLQHLEPIRYTRAETVEFLKAVSAAGRGPKDAAEAAAGCRPVADPEVAQLLVWAVHTLLDELKPADAPGLPAIVSELDSAVVNRLRPNLATPAPPAPPAPDDAEYEKLRKASLVPVEARIADRMKTVNAFDAEKFRDAFRRIEPIVAGIK